MCMNESVKAKSLTREREHSDVRSAWDESDVGERARERRARAKTRTSDTGTTKVDEATVVSTFRSKLDAKQSKNQQKAAQNPAYPAGNGAVNAGYTN